MIKPAKWGFSMLFTAPL